MQSKYFNYSFIKSNIRFILVNIIKKFKLNKYPTVIQLPITNKCNLKCVMCNVPNIDTKNEFSVKTFERILNDTIFSKVKAVGINGGEPFILSNLDEYIDVILNLRKLKAIHIISNGFFVDKIQDKIKLISKKCKEKDVKLYVSISLDGVGEVHDKIRGKKSSFANAIRTIDFLRNSEYCDSLNVTCTVVKQNVDYLSELQVFCEENNIDIKYRLGIENSRIDNYSKYQEYHIESDSRTKMLAREFFYKKIFESNNINDMYKYWSIFEFLTNDKKIRHLGCMWKNDGITLTPQGGIYYCATKSKKIGDILKDSGKEIYLDKKNINYRKELVAHECNKCIHDYSGVIKIRSIIKFYKFIINRRTWTRKMRRLTK